MSLQKLYFVLFYNVLYFGPVAYIINKKNVEPKLELQKSISFDTVAM